MSNEQFSSVWDAICDTQEEAENMFNDGSGGADHQHRP